MSTHNNKKLTEPGERLRMARESFELSQGEFARKLGYPSYQAIRYLENARKKFRPHIAKLIQYEFGISETWLLEGKGDMLIDNTKKESVDVQKLVGDIVAKQKPPHEKKLLPKNEKLTEIMAYIEDVARDSERAQRLFVMQFMKCFEEDFLPWSETRNRAKTPNDDDGSPSPKSHD